MGVILIAALGWRPFRSGATLDPRVDPDCIAAITLSRPRMLVEVGHTSSRHRVCRQLLNTAQRSAQRSAYGSQDQRNNDERGDGDCSQDAVHRQLLER